MNQTVFTHNGFPKEGIRSIIDGRCGFGRYVRRWMAVEGEEQDRRGDNKRMTTRGGGTMGTGLRSGRRDDESGTRGMIGTTKERDLKGRASRRRGREFGIIIATS